MKSYRGYIYQSEVVSIVWTWDSSRFWDSILRKLYSTSSPSILNWLKFNYWNTHFRQMQFADGDRLLIRLLYYQLYTIDFSICREFNILQTFNYFNQLNCLHQINCPLGETVVMFFGCPIFIIIIFFMLPRIRPFVTC